MISNTEFKAIAEMDLDPIKVKLMHKESGEGWTLQYANKIEFEYRRFLYLIKVFPHEQVAPQFDVDIFWHYHILDTLKYAVDCETVFGYFLHHFPYVGLRGEEDEAAHKRIGARMKDLYEETFGEPYLQSLMADTGQATSAWSTTVIDAQAKSAWSTVAVGQRTAASEIAWSTVAIKPAWSTSTVKTVWPTSTAAWSTVPVTAARETDRARAAAADAAALQRFYTVRPALAAI